MLVLSRGFDYPFLSCLKIPFTISNTTGKSRTLTMELKDPLPWRSQSQPLLSSTNTPGSWTKFGQLMLEALIYQEGAHLCHRVTSVSLYQVIGADIVMRYENKPDKAASYLHKYSPKSV